MKKIRTPAASHGRGKSKGTTPRPSPETSRLIACVMLRHVGLPASSPYYCDIFKGIEEEVTARRHEMLFTSVPYTALWTSDQRLRTSPVTPRFHHLRGALLIGGLTEAFALAYRQRGIPVVLVDKSEPLTLSSVTPDNFGAAREAAHHLIQLGHRRIAFLAAPFDPVVKARYDGFLAALQTVGLTFNPSDFIHGGYQTDTAARATAEYVKKYRKNLPTAIVAINDEAALGAIKALRRLRIAVPKEMSVVSFDDIAQAASSRPPLTTMHIPRIEMGRLAVQTLFEQIEQSAEPVQVRLDARLIVRKSTARPD